MTSLTLSDLLNNIVIVQQNKTRHFINCFRIERFARFVGYNIVIFSAQHSHIKREERKTILQKDLFSIQDRDRGAIGLGLLYYYKGLPVALLINMCTALSIVNDIQ